MANGYEWRNVERWANSPELSEGQRVELGKFLDDERAQQSQPGSVFHGIYYASKLGARAGIANP